MPSEVTESFALMICDESGKRMVTVKQNGEVTLYPGCDVNKAARIFWDAIEFKRQKAAEVAKPAE